jgi:hypothetical protein
MFGAEGHQQRSSAEASLLVFGILMNPSEPPGLFEPAVLKKSQSCRKISGRILRPDLAAVFDLTCLGE